MNKFFALVLIIVIGTVLGSLYGVLHDQITYSISHEYYTKIKFIQFGLNEWGLGQNIGTKEAPNIKLDNPRLGVTIVGIIATWWVGFLSAALLGFLGIIQRNGKEMFDTVMKAFFIMVMVALIIGILGFFCGKILFTYSYIHWHLPSDIIEIEKFVVVAFIHNFSYIGVIIGLVIGITYSIKVKNLRTVKNELRF